MTLSAPLALLQDPTPPQTSSAETQSTGQNPPAPKPGLFGDGSMLMIVAIVAIFYFVLIGPERKNRKKRETMLKALAKGDRVMTTGGMYATVAAIDGERVTLQIDEGVRAKFSRAAIQDVLPEDSSSSAPKSS